MVEKRDEKELVMPITLWLELSALSREVWSRSLEEREGWARQAEKGEKQLGSRAMASTNMLPSQEKPSLKPIFHGPVLPGGQH